MYLLILLPMNIWDISSFICSFVGFCRYTMSPDTLVYLKMELLGQLL